MSVAERVARGAALLDLKVPGWAGRINLHTLDMDHCYLCVLGQLFGFYWSTAVYPTLGLDHMHVANPAINHGFESRSGQYGGLRAAWVGEVLKRRKGAAGDNATPAT